MEKPKIRFKGYQEDWEQRKLGDVADVTKLAGFEFTEHVVYSDEGNIIALRGLNIKNGQLILDDVKYIDGSNFSKLSRSKLFIDDIMFTYVGTVGEVAIIKENDRFYLAPNVSRIRVKSDDSPKFISHYMRTDNFKNKIIFPLIATSSQPALSMENIRKFTINIPINKEEQDCLAKYFDSLDHLITLHHRKQIYVLNTRIYTKTTLIITKEKKKMPELEKVIEDKLIEQLVFGESQWTYREDLKTEEDLWKNFRYILEQNNKARLDGQPLSDAEFEQVKNQLQFSSFYKAGEWLVGENGKAMVHVQRDTEKLHLVVMNHEHIAGGSSVYEVINQYNALKDDDITTVARDRRFDVTLD